MMTWLVATFLLLSLTAATGRITWKYSGDEHVCSLYVYTDPFLWRQVHKNHGFNATATYEAIQHLIEASVEHANNVFSVAEFYGSGTRIHKGISFVLADYHIDNDQDCQPQPVRRAENFDETDCEEMEHVSMRDLCRVKPRCRTNQTNIFCNHIQSMRFYLHAFSTQAHQDFCLAFAFTFRNLEDFQGIAWIKGHDPNRTSTQTYYGYCSERDPRCETGGNQFYYRNTGVVNAQVHGDYFIEDVFKDIFVHELGHSLGAKHDDRNPLCNTLGIDNYLMTGNAKKILLAQITHQLSICSNREIGRNLDHVTCWSERRGRPSKEEAAKSARIESAREIVCLLTFGLFIFIFLVLLTLIGSHLQKLVLVRHRRQGDGSSWGRPPSGGLLSSKWKHSRLHFTIPSKEKTNLLHRSIHITANHSFYNGVHEAGGGGCIGSINIGGSSSLRNELKVASAAALMSQQSPPCRLPPSKWSHSCESEDGFRGGGGGDGVLISQGDDSDHNSSSSQSNNCSGNNSSCYTTRDEAIY